MEHVRPLAFLASLVLGCTLSAPLLAQECVQPDPSLTGWWSGNATVEDMAGSNDGVLEGGAAFTSASAGWVDQAFELDGVDDWVNLGTTAGNFGTGDFTVELWVNFDVLGPEQILMEKFIGPSGPGWTLTKLGGSTIRLHSSGSGGTVVLDAGASLNVGQWHHVALTREGGNHTIYLDGMPAGTTTGAIPDLSTTSSLKIGHRGNPGDTPGSGDSRGFYLDGRVDEAATYDQALDAGEILAIYEAGMVGRCRGIHLAFESAAPVAQLQNETWGPFSVAVRDNNGDLVTTASDPITVALTSGTGVLSGTTTRVPVGGIATFDDLAYDTAGTATIQITSGDLSAVSATILVAAEVSDLFFSGATAGGFAQGASAIAAVGSPYLFRSYVRNAGSGEATADIELWLGNDLPGGSPQLIDTSSITIPAGWSGPIGGGVFGLGLGAFQLSWTPEVAGPQSLFVVARNTTPGAVEATPENNRFAFTACVECGSEELSVAAGERIAWPGAEAVVPITITNTGSGPVTISNVLLGPPAWLSLITPLVGETLEAGESILALTELSVPPETMGAPLGSAPVEYDLQVLVQVPSTEPGVDYKDFLGNLTVKVFEEAASTVTVQVVDALSGAPLANALVAAEGLQGSFVTGPAGTVTLQLPPGPNGFFAYRTGYGARAVGETIVEGSDSVEIPLTPGQTLGVQQVVSMPLSTDVIEERGIDVDDPANNDVFDFTVALKIGGAPIVLRNVELPRVPPTSGSDTFTGIAYGAGGAAVGGGGGGAGTGGGGGGGGYVVTGRFDYNEFGRTETWIVIPGQVWVLKQFFEVTMTVFNRATAENASDVQLVDVSATLNLPPGLGLPDLGGDEQSATQDLGTIDAGAQGEAVWVIRGDATGEYQLSGLVSGDLFAFGSFQTELTALASSNTFDVTLAKIRCEFETPERVEEGEPFEFAVVVTNESTNGAVPVRAQLVRVVLEEQDLLNCTLEGADGLPGQSPAVSFRYGTGGEVLSATYEIGDLDSGQSGRASFLLVSEVTGTVTERLIENGCGAAPSPSVEAVPDPPTIVDHPDPVNACLGATATFQVTADGFAPITYQWHKDGDELPGETGFVLTIPDVAADDAGTYHVVVTNEGGDTPSDGSQLGILAPPAFVPMPTIDPPAVCEGDAEVTLSVDVSGALGFQWRKGGANIAGETGSTLTIANPTRDDGGQYDVMVTNPCGSATSPFATLVVGTAPVVTISSQPPPTYEGDGQILQVSVGETVQFDLSVEGSEPLMFQWWKGGAQLPGETGPSYTIASAAPGDAGAYSVVVTNDCGTTTRSTIPLTVEQPVLIEVDPGGAGCLLVTGPGAIPVALLGSATFDSSLVDTASIQVDAPGLGLSGPATFVGTEDVNGDSFADARFEVFDDDGQFQVGTDTATLTGSLLDGTPIVGTAAVCFEEDATPPLLAVASHGPGQVVSESPLTVELDVEDQSALTVASDPVLAWSPSSFPAPAAGTSTATWSLAEGSNSLEVTATDGALQATIVTLELVLDTRIPDVTITSPADGAVLDTPSVTLAADVDDATATQIVSTPAGIDTTLAAGGGSVSGIVGLVEGENSLAVSATDEAGHTGGTTVTVTLDTIAPSVVVLSPVPDAVLGASPATLSLEVDDATTTTVVFGGNTVALEEGGGNVEGDVALTEGANTVVITVVDAAGNSTTVEHPLTLDLSAPLVTIDPALDGACFGPVDFPEGSPPVIGVFATVDDVSETTVGSNPAGVSGTLPAGGGTVAGAIELVEGSNAITVSATDETDRTSADVVSIVFDSTPPDAQLVSPLDGAAVGGTVDFDAIAVDPAPGSGVDTVLLLVDGDVVQTFTAQPYEEDLDTTLLSDGLHTFAAVGRDGKGNEHTASVQVLVDNTLPSLTITGPVDGATVSGTIAFDVSASDGGSSLGSITMLAAGGAPSPFDDSAVFPAPTPTADRSSLIDTTALPDGPLELTVAALDAVGNEASATITVIVDNAAPEGCQLLPADGTRVEGVVELVADSPDPDLESIEILVDGESLGTSATVPFEIAFDTTTRLDGAMVVTAISRDFAGNVASCSSTLRVDNVSVRVFPRILVNRLRFPGRFVRARLEGPSLDAMLPTGEHEIELRVPGGSSVPLDGVFPSSGTTDFDGDGEPEVWLRFLRRDVLASVRAGIFAGEIQPNSTFSVGIFVDDNLVGVSRMFVVGGGGAN